MLRVHARDEFTPVDEVMRALDDLVRSGKVLYVGVPGWPAWEIARANTLAELRGWTAFAGSQLRCNLLERTPERELLPQARGFDMTVFAWGPPAAGKLTGKYRRGESGRLGDGGADADPRQDAVIDAVLGIAERSGRLPGQVALAWLLGRPGDVVPIVGATGPRQLADNLASVDVTLDADALARLDEVSAPSLGFPHDFLREPVIRQNVYGPRRGDIRDPRTPARQVH